VMDEAKPMVKEVTRRDGSKAWKMNQPKAKPAAKAKKPAPRAAKKDKPYTMSWLAALKKWNGSHGKWCIPKGGTDEYDEVERIRLGRSNK